MYAGVLQVEGPIGGYCLILQTQFFSSELADFFTRYSSICKESLHPNNPNQTKFVDTIHDYIAHFPIESILSKLPKRNMTVVLKFLLCVLYRVIYRK